MEEQFEIIRFLRVINKRKTIIIISVLIILLSALVATARMTPEYEAAVQILVSQGQAISPNQPMVESYQGILMSERLAKTFSQMIVSRVLAEKVVEKLELPLLPDELKQKVSAQPVKDTQILQLTVIDSNPALAKKLANTYADEFSKMVKESMSSSALISVKVMEQAVVPLDPVRPKPLLNAVLALFVGLIASIGFAFVLEMLDVTVKETEEMEELIGLPSLGRVPKVEDPSLWHSDNRLTSESFRSLRTNLQYLNFDQSIKTIIMASPNMEEGKTTVASNLAIVFAQAGSKVLLVDCDLRRPRVRQLFNMEEGQGLSNVLIGAADAELVVRDTDIAGLQVITSGPIPPNPADLLDSDRMTNLLTIVKGYFDLVILDCPPVLGIADTAILASKADGVLLITSFGRTKKGEVVAARNSLNKVGARVIGFITNKVQVASKNNYYYYKAYTENQPVSDATQQAQS